jgi:hypothetical protein
VRDWGRILIRSFGIANWLYGLTGTYFLVDGLRRVHQFGLEPRPYEAKAYYFLVTINAVFLVAIFLTGYWLVLIRRTYPLYPAPSRWNKAKATFTVDRTKPTRKLRIAAKRITNSRLFGDEAAVTKRLEISQTPSPREAKAKLTRPMDWLGGFRSHRAMPK